MKATKAKLIRAILVFMSLGFAAADPVGGDKCPPASYGYFKGGCKHRQNITTQTETLAAKMNTTTTEPELSR